MLHDFQLKKLGKFLFIFGICRSWCASIFRCPQWPDLLPADEDEDVNEDVDNKDEKDNDDDDDDNDDDDCITTTMVNITCHAVPFLGDTAGLTDRDDVEPLKYFSNHCQKGNFNQ